MAAILICKKCGQEQSSLEAKVIRKDLFTGGYHLMAYCYKCEGFIKNIPHAKPEMWFYGKHKGEPIKVIAQKDPQYLRWFLEKNDLKPNLRLAIEQALEVTSVKEPELFGSN